MNISERIKKTAVIQAAVFFFSFSGILSKLAAQFPAFSWPFLLSYVGSMAVLGVYALVWQQILKQDTLTTAYGNRAISVVWSVLWGVLLFGETLTWNMVLGTAVIIVGTYFVVTGNG